jgi:S1-C subfamily serine protease
VTIILALDDGHVTRIEKLLSEIHKKRAGEKVNLTVYREGFEYSFEVVLAGPP